jgi:NTP pyrophosphatase (non-canonical NTP hydrolase)
MNVDEYQKRAKAFLFRGDSKTSDLLGLALGVCGEAGELAEKIKKLYFNKNMEMSEQELNLISKEIGDTIWYLAALASELNLSLDGILENNLNKLESRKSRGVQKGDGDER